MSRARTAARAAPIVPSTSRETAGLSAGRGYTLLELMIALAVGTLVTCAALALYRQQRDAFEQAADWAAVTEAGHAALDLMVWQARLAGLALQADGVDNTERARQATLLRRLPVFGCAAGRPAGSADSPRCDADSRGSDGVQFMYAANNLSSWADSHGAATDCLGQALAAGAVAVARFFTRLSSASGEPELYCDGGARLGNTQPVVEGVEMLRLAYWLDGSDVAQASLAADQWPRVRALEICLVARGKPGSQRLPYLDCDGRRVAGSDGRRRQVFRMFVALRNHVATP